MTTPGRSGDPSTVTGVLIIRVWREPEHPVTLRARITRSVSADPENGLGSPEPVAKSITVASADEALAAVRAWLESFVGSEQASMARQGPGA